MEKLLYISTITKSTHCVPSEQCHTGCTVEMCNSLEQYISTFTPKEMQAYLIFIAPSYFMARGCYAQFRRI